MSKQKKAPKKAVSAKQVAIAKAVPTPLAVLGTVDERITDSLVALAGVLSADLTGPVLGRATLVIKKFEATAEALYENARKRMLKVIAEEGVTTTEAGTRAIDVDGIHAESRPRGGGYDDKKVETMFRAKGLNPEGWMLQTVSYSYDAGMMQQAIRAGKVTPDELETCKKPMTYNLYINEKDKV